MLICRRAFTNPFLNIAAEEYFIQNCTQDMCMLWINEPSIIIGKHQHTYSEINFSFVKKNNIPVIRRISGGGTVFHDLGNINFSFIQHVNSQNKVDFNRFTAIIINLFSDLGINARLGKRNSIYIGDYKVSGHAEHLFKNKILHHGTILFDTNLDMLNECLNPQRVFTTKALESVRSEVANVKSLLNENETTASFISKLQTWLLKYYPQSIEYIIPIEEYKIIVELAEKKYSSWEWNYGYSPAYSFDILINNTSIQFFVTNGIIIEIKSESIEIQRIFEPLRTKRHCESEIRQFADLNPNLIKEQGLSKNDFIYKFF